MSSGSVSGGSSEIYFTWDADPTYNGYPFGSVACYYEDSPGNIIQSLVSYSQSGSATISNVLAGTYTCTIEAAYTDEGHLSVEDYIVEGEPVTVGGYTPPPPSYSAPAAPTLTAPPNGTYADVSVVPDVIFTGTYNSTDGYACNARAMRIKPSGGTYSYYNASTGALQSTVVWNPISIQPAGTGSFTLPATLLADGTTYNWSMADQEAGENLQGPFASDLTLNAQAAPTVTITAPTGTVATSTPAVAWIVTPAAGASVTAGQVRVFSPDQYGAQGFDPGTSAATWDSGVIAGAVAGLTVGVDLNNGGTYRFYVQATETGGEVSSWTYSTATVQLAPAAPPLVTAAAGNAATGLPVAALTVQDTNNMLSAADASFEANIGGWAGDENTAVVQSNTWSVDGSFSLEMSPRAAGNMNATSSVYPVSPNTAYSATATLFTATTVRTASISISWLNSSGEQVGVTTSAAATDLTSQPGRVYTVTGTAPPTAVSAQLLVTVTAADEPHYVDKTGIRPGGDPTWFQGGLVGAAQIIVTRDDGQYVRGASLANPVTVPASQVLDLVDAEVVPTDVHTWTAVSVVILDPTSRITSAASAPSNSVAVPGGQGWWEFDPTDLSTAVNAQMTGYNPQVTEQSTAHIVLGQTVPNVIASAMGGIDGSATFETFDAPTYQGLTSLLLSQKTVFISDPFGDNQGVSYVRFGPQTGGMSSGTGNKVRDANLHPSTASGPHHTIAVTWVAQNRPAV